MPAPYRTAIRTATFLNNATSSEAIDKIIPEVPQGVLPSACPDLSSPVFCKVANQIVGSTYRGSRHNTACYGHTIPPIETLLKSSKNSQNVVDTLVIDSYYLKAPSEALTSAKTTEDALLTLGTTKDTIESEYSIIERFRSNLASNPRDALGDVFEQRGAHYLAQLLMRELPEIPLESPVRVDIAAFASNRLLLQEELSANIKHRAQYYEHKYGGISTNEDIAFLATVARDSALQCLSDKPDKLQALGWVIVKLKAGVTSNNAEKYSQVFETIAHHHPTLSSYKVNLSIGEEFGKPINAVEDRDYRNYVLDVARDSTLQLHYLPSDHALRRFLQVSTTDMEKLLQHSTSIRDHWAANTEEGYRAILAAMIAALPSWQAPHTVDGARLCQRTFGSKAVLDYGCKQGLDPHDAFYAFGNVIKLMNAVNDNLQRRNGTPYSKKQFKNNILDQIVRDNSKYDAGTAHHYFNEQLDSLPIDISGTLRKAAEYNTLPKISNYLENIAHHGDIASDWISLKRWFAFAETVEVNDIKLKKLKELHDKGVDPQKLQYITSLMFDGDSKVDLRSALAMVDAPEEFLARQEDESGSVEIEGIQPIEMVSLGGSDITADEVVNALTGGSIDSHQLFPPFSINTTVIERETPLHAKEAMDDIRQALIVGIGSRKDKIAGKAQNPRKLFSEASTLIGKENLLKFLNGGEIQVDTAEHRESVSKLHNIIFGDNDIGLGKKHFSRDSVEGQLLRRNKYGTIRATMFPKSSAEGAKAGNDTACCMPFGSAKNNQYLFSPAVGQLVVQVKKGDNTWRTIAQSVVTLDQEGLGPDFFDYFLENGQSTPLPAILACLEQRTLACDNIEIAPNYADNRFTQAIADAYATFFTKYIPAHREHFARRGIVVNEAAIIAGAGYTDLEIGSSIPNSFLPTSFLAYSDKYDITSLQLQVAPSDNERKVEDTVGITKRGRSITKLLHPEDTWAVSYVKQQGWNDSSFDDGPLKVHNVLQLNVYNQAKGRPNLCLGHYEYRREEDDTADSSKRLALTSYVLAFETTQAIKDTDEDTKPSQPTPYVYVEEVVADPSSKFAGGLIMNEWMEHFKQQYSGREAPPIFAEARTRTMLPILQKHADKWGVTVEVLEEYDPNEDEIVPVVMRRKDT